VHDSFAESALWGFKVEAEEVGAEGKDHALVDATDFFLRDDHGIPAALRRTKQGAFHLDGMRCAIYLPQTKNFPLNTEVEATLTFAGEDPGTVGARRNAFSGINHRAGASFVRAASAGRVQAAGLRSALEFLWDQLHGLRDAHQRADRETVTARHRLEKKDPKAAVSEAVQPIKY